MIYRTGQPVQDCQERSARTGQPEHGNQNRTTKTYKCKYTNTNTNNLLNPPTAVYIEEGKV
jgi:hypothetical protein